MLSLYEQHLCRVTPEETDIHRLWFWGWPTYLIAAFMGLTEAEVYNEFFGKWSRKLNYNPCEELHRMRKQLEDTA